MNKTSSQNEYWLFLKKFLRHGTRIASFFPSSASLASALCRFVDPDKPQKILEIGAGTGAVTRIALQKMHPESTLLAVEQDADFVAILQESCPRAQVIHCDAQEMLAKINALGIQQVDVILNSLPTPSLHSEVNKIILNQCQQLMKSEIPISQITLMPWVYLKMYQRLFKKVEFELVLKSIPPGGVYYCWGIRETSIS